MEAGGVTGWRGDGGNIRFIRLIRAQFQHSLRKLLINWQVRLLCCFSLLDHLVPVLGKGLLGGGGEG